MRPAWRHFLVFGAFAFAFLLLVPLGQAALSIESLDFAAMGRAASARTGTPWTSSLFDVVQLAAVAPGLWLLILGSAAPTLAAFAATALARCPSGFSELVSRFDPRRLARAPAKGVFAVAGVGAAMIVGLVVTSHWRMSMGMAVERDVGLAVLAATLFATAPIDQGALLEEGGWRGFAQPVLQQEMSPMSAALIVGLLWGLWHVPRDVVGGVVERLGPTTYVFQFLPVFVSGTVAVSVIAAFCMNACGGSIIPAILVHGLANDAVGLSGAASIDVALTPAFQATKAAPQAFLAVVICVLSGEMREAASKRHRDGAASRS